MARSFGATAFYAAWFLVAALHPRLPWYLPLERTVAMKVPPLSVGMDFYAKVAIAAAGGVAGFAAGWFFERRSSAAARARWRARGWTWALTLLFWCATMEVVVLSRRAPIALPAAHPERPPPPPEAED